MNKKILAGALILGASTMFGLVGCDDKDIKGPQEVVVPTYTVTFDDKNATTEDVKVEFSQGDTQLNSIPNCPTKDGFAGVWESFTLSDKDITVSAKYGDGTQDNPYMIATSGQFSYMIKKYSSEHTTQYKKDGVLVANEDVNGNFTNGKNEKLEGEALDAVLVEVTSKIEFYKTCSVTYTNNQISSIDFGTKVYFKLISDIDLSVLQGEDNGGKFINASIDGLKPDGTRCQLTGLRGDKFRNTDGAIFNNVVGNTTISNIDIKLVAKKNLATLVGCVRKGTTNLENISVSVLDGGQTFMYSDDNNESPFVWHVLGNATVGSATLNMTNCVNNANIISTAKYFGIFVGGYATDGSKVNFDNCVNNGGVISGGMVGVFFGNNYKSPKEYTITNCVNNGMITAYAMENSHVLIPNANGSDSFCGESLSKYDNDSSVQKNKINKLSGKYVMTKEDNGTDLKVSNNDGNLQAGLYELTISSFAGNGTSTLRTNITQTIKLTSSVDSCTFAGVLYGMMDLNTYISTYGESNIPSDNEAWTEVVGYAGIKYFLDAENGYYVFDYSGYEKANSISKLKLNVSADEIEVIIIVKDAQNNIIQFVVE